MYVSGNQFMKNIERFKGHQTWLYILQNITVVGWGMAAAGGKMKTEGVGKNNEKEGKGEMKKEKNDIKTHQ